MTNANQLSEPTPELYNAREIAPHFRVGAAATHNLVTMDGKRHFMWNRGEDDMRFAELAGWQKLIDLDNTSDSRASLIIPTTVRPAGSVFGGMQAWPNEKEQVVNFMSSYIQRVHNELGGVDTGLSLNTVGVSRGNEEMLVLPPHNLQTDVNIIGAWAEALRTDMAQVLARDEQRSYLMEILNEAIDSTTQRTM